MWWCVLCAVGAAAAVALWWRGAASYWATRGVPYVQPAFPFGNFRESVLGRRSLGLDIAALHHELSEHGFGGIYGCSRPMMLITDPDLIRQIFVKNFSVFHGRKYSDEPTDPMKHNLFFLTESRWRTARENLSPFFTTSRLKKLMETMVACGRRVCGEVTAASVDVHLLAARYSACVVSAVALGVDAQEFVVLKAAEPRIVSFLAFCYPKIALMLRYDKNYLSQNIRNLIQQTVAMRCKSSENKNDFIQLLLGLVNGVSPLKKHKNHESGLGFTTDDVYAHLASFYFAGLETSAATLSFALHELAVNPSVQAKLHQEIDAELGRGQSITYDAVTRMRYLDRVVAETLRKYPPIQILLREASEDYQLPGKSVAVERGTVVAVSLQGLHHDPRLYPEPGRFEPDRFLAEVAARRHPYAYLPFGEGPRTCLGQRLALLQTKVGLICLLAQFQVRPCPRTEHPVPLDPRSMILRARSGLHLLLTRRPITAA